MTAGIAAAGAGTIVKGLGAIQAFKGAKQMGKLVKEIPEAQPSQYVSPLIGTAQTALYDNPLARAAQRQSQTSMANVLYNARTGDPQALAALAAGVYGQGQQAELQARMADEQLREQRRQAYYGALQTGMQAEQNLYSNRLTSLQSKASLLGAAAQTKTSALNNIGEGLFDIAGSLVKAGATK